MPDPDNREQPAPLRFVQRPEEYRRRTRRDERQARTMVVIAILMALVVLAVVGFLFYELSDIGL